MSLNKGYNILLFLLSFFVRIVFFFLFNDQLTTFELLLHFCGKKKKAITYKFMIDVVVNFTYNF